VTNTEPAEAVAAKAEATAARRTGLAVTSVGLAAAAFAVVFFPFGALPAGVLAVAGLWVGIACLIRDPGFTVLALTGTVLSSAAVSAAAILAFLRAFGA
jgi:hypothetical protein